MRCDTLVHLGNSGVRGVSTVTQGTARASQKGGEERQLTMDAFSILLLLAVEDGVFVLGPHLRLGRHLGLPPLQVLERLALPRQRLVDGRHDGVDGLEAVSLASLLELGQPPGDLPARER